MVQTSLRQLTSSLSADKNQSSYPSKTASDFCNNPIYSDPNPVQ